jgi:outer membrane protein
MRKLIITLSIGIFALCCSTQMQAQKFGYINSAALLAEMPEVKAADSELTVLQTQLKKKGEDMVAALQAKYTEVSQKDKNGEYSPKQLETESTKLKEEEGKIAAFEQEMGKQLSGKRETLLQPILDKVNKAIAEVAKEAGYSYVFDASANILLYADTTTDITAIVKQKLGL